MFKRSSRFSWSRHLYVRVYAAVLLSVAVAVALFYALLTWYPEAVGQAPIPQNFDGTADYASEILPPATADGDTLQAALNHRRWRRYAGMALYDAHGNRLAATGITLPSPDRSATTNGWLNGQPPVLNLHLADGRWLVAQRLPPPARPPRFDVQVWLVLLALVLGVGAWPVARRMTRRLERLQKSVDALGEGQLSTRVAIEGQDEIARLARSFNRSARRIEQLVEAQKSLLANASHELRSPLTRIRMAVELMGEQPTGAMREELIRNIGELDQLVEEILLASRLEALGEALPRHEPVDLTALLAEECARVDASLEAPQATLSGDARLLRRMLRNLLENARRYGDDSPVSARIDAGLPGRLVVDVCDGGRGVPESERENIFQPFYRLAGASEREGGVGLGLALVRQIARAHGGDVRCLPNGPQGSCFRVTLPA